MKRWLRREVLMPLFFLALYGGALFLLTRKLQQLDLINPKGFMTWLLIISVVIYVVLLVTTISHIATAYLLERYDPGDPRSVRRLARQWRFRLPGRWDGSAFSLNFPLLLHDADFEPEGGDRRTGQVYARAGLDFWTRRPLYDRVLWLETGFTNIFRVDQLIKETIDQLDHVERPSRRNVLVIAVRMENRRDAASAAAGCVNYMGRFQSGTLFPILLDINHRRLYFPVNHSFISRAHRGLYSHLRTIIRSAGLRALEDPTGAAIRAGNDPVRNTAQLRGSWPEPAELEREAADLRRVNVPDFAPEPIAAETAPVYAPEPTMSEPPVYVPEPAAAAAPIVVTEPAAVESPVSTSPEPAAASEPPASSMSEPAAAAPTLVTEPASSMPESTAAAELPAPSTPESPAAAELPAPAAPESIAPVSAEPAASPPTDKPKKVQRKKKAGQSPS